MSETEQQQAPSDYVSASTFEELGVSEATRRAITARGYTSPTPVQAKTIPAVLAGRDLLVRSKTGTGKTASFGIPIVDLVDPNGPVQALVLCNTRELALQGAGELSALGEGRGVKVVAVYGGSSMDAQLKALEDGATIVVATPGRLLDLLERRKLSLKDLRFIVLDEADEMLAEGFLEDVRRVLRQAAPVHQTLLFSATLTPGIDDLIKTHMKNPETILLSGDTYTVEGIRHVRYFANDAYPKPRNLMYLLQIENPTSAIIFCNTRDDVSLLATVMGRAGFDAEKLSGEVSQKDRERVMGRIKRGELRYMVATDLAARGIDISDLSHVINYSLPEDPSTYLHRVGRTGRIGKKGTAVSLVRGTELHTLSILEKTYSIKFESFDMPTPEVAHKQWVDKHVEELRNAMGSSLYDSYLPLAQDLRARPGGDVLIAYALKYFYTHSRPERAQPVLAERPVNEPTREVEVKKRREERRTEERRPKMEGASEHAAPPPERKPEPRPEPAAEAEAPRRNRLFVSLGSDHGVDADTIKVALATLAGLESSTITHAEVKPGFSYIEVAEASVDGFLAANGKMHGERKVGIEVARPQQRRRRRSA